MVQKALADHPALAGHFPGNPIVPGVVLLQSVAEDFENIMVGARLKEFSKVKFLKSVLPDILFSIEYPNVGSDRASFRITYKDDCLVSGNLHFEING